LEVRFNMKIVFLPKYKISGEVLIERSLPCEGTIFAKKGSVVQAFDKVGEGRMFLEESVFKYEGELVKKRGDFVSQGEVVSKGKKSLGGQLVTKSPATGYFVKVDTRLLEITVRKPSRTFELIAGVPGFVTAVVAGHGVLITTRAVVALGIFGYGSEVGGEIVVLGDEDDAVRQDDLGDNLAGKIVVCGHLTRESYSKGAAIGVLGFVCGGANFAITKSFKAEGPAVLIMEGFGDTGFSPLLFSYLKGIATRFVILRACENELIVPEADPQNWCTITNPYFVDIKIGQTAQIFSYHNFGSFGKVESFDEKKGTVKLSLMGKKEMVEAGRENVGVVIS